MSTEKCKIQIYRPVLDSEVYKYHHVPKKPKNPFRKFSIRSCIDLILSFLPILKFLKNYNWRNDTLSDIISGFTVGIMNIPQGLAYAVLALLPPVNGLYVGFIGPLLYAVFGQCPSFSIGTFALGSLLISEGIKEVETNLNDGMPFDDSTRQNIAVSITFLTGVFQLFFGIIQLGSFSAIMAPSMIKAFNSATAVHVFTSQIKSLFGMTKLKVKSGMFSVIITYIGMIENYYFFNWRTFIVSIVAITLLLLTKILISPLVKKKLCQFPIPIELMLVISFTLIFRFTSWSQDYNISTVGNISRGMPSISLPEAKYFKYIVKNSAIIAIITTSINISLVKRIQGKTIVRYNQEIFSYGTINILGSFLSCFVFSASLSRSLVAQDSGGKTPLAGIFSALFMMSILLYFSPFFSSLPKCILAAIVVVALKNLLLEITCLPKLWRRYKPDFYIFLITYCVTVFIDITVGLLVGILLCILLLIYSAQEIKFFEATRHNKYQDVFVPLVLDNDVEDCTPENLPARLFTKFKKKFNKVNYYDMDMLEPMKSQLILNGYIRIFKIFGDFNFISSPKFVDDFQHYLEETENKQSNNLMIIIFDLDGVSKIDPYGVNKLGELRMKMNEKGVNIIFSGDLYRYKYLRNDLNFKTQPLDPLCLDDNANNSFRQDPHVFATLLDAVHYSIVFIEKFEYSSINISHIESDDPVANL